MNDHAIQVEGLSKRYRLGGNDAGANLREAIAGALRRTTGRLQGRHAANAESQRELWALRDVSLSVPAGQVLGIVGANGAGKSTLLKVLSQITEPTAGRATIRGRVASLLEVGTGFHPELTGRENVFLNGAILGMTRAEITRKLDEIVAFSGVERFLDTPVKHYSSGMTVRLAFSVAAHLEPQILIVDEVLAVGDAAFQRRCLGKMQEVAQSHGRTVLFVSHNLGAVRSLCDRCVLLEAGRLVYEGSAAQVVDRYLGGAVAGGVGGRVDWTGADEAPGCELIRLQSVQIIGTDGRAAENHALNQPIQIEAVYRVIAPITGMRTIVQVSTHEGVAAFASTDHDLAPATILPGEYRTRCVIPAGLLNAGKYIVTLSAGIPGQRSLIPPRELIAFTTHGPTPHGSSYPEAWPGAVAPRLEWSVHHTPDIRSAAA